ncbi:hypothetical protein FACS189452_02390 [Bacteroidia bacterium]|nr:hypothetical protein FACS189452_02390 [Bacteroidia bacterium]
MLDYSLVENLLTPAPDDAMAQVVNVRSYSEDEIADLMLKRGTLLTKADILAVLEVYREVVTDLVADGAGVNTALMHISPSIAGVFNGLGDSFDPTRHTVKVNLNQGAALRNAAGRIKTKKVQVADPIPYIVEVKDTLSGSTNDHLTAGGVIQMRGSRLKLVENDATNGIFLLPTTDGAEIRLSVVVENKPARLIAMLPADLAAGEYYLEVRSNYSHGNKPSLILKTGRFHKALTVGA